MTKFNILHITDLHIDNVDSTNENLRKKFYKEFIDSLIAKISNSLKENINYIVCTGDFVNIGKLNNFDHATTILDYFCKKLEIPHTKVSICIGNHDSDRTLDEAGNPIEARNNFKKLQDDFKFSNLLIERDVYKIYTDDTREIYSINFDSTYGSAGNNLPSKLSDEQIDEIIDDVDNNVPPDKFLIVLSHYPMIIFDRSQVVAEVDNWVDDHMWKSGYFIVDRIYRKRQNSLTFWFFGDGHLPDFWSYNKFHHFLMTGMIGGNYINPTYIDKITGIVTPYNKTNEVKVIQVNTENTDIKINTFSYRSKGRFSPHTGFWEHALSDIRAVDNPFHNSDRTNHASNDQFESEKLSDTSTSLISTSVQDEIISQIKERKLYSFNRYSTSPNEVSLGWVSITKLFEKNELLSRCVEKSVEWLDKLQSVKIDKGNTIFIGIDFWGAIFASQASIIKDIENYCIATKSKSEHNILLERPEFLCQKLKEKSKDLVNIVFFTDVISTGNTVISIKDKISSCINNSDKINWIALSIISDTKQGRKFQLNKFAGLGTLCADLRIPILATTDLPDVDILPNKFDIS